MENFNRKKVCLIIPSLRHGGSERVMSLIANDWAEKRDVDVYLILLTKQKKYYHLHNKITLIEPNISYSKKRLSKLFFKIWIFIFLRRKCNQIAPDSVLSFNERYNNIVLLSLLGTPYRKYVSDRNSPFKDIGFFHNKLRNVLYKRASGIIAQTITAKEVLYKNTGNKNIKVISNPLRKITSSNVKMKNIILNIGRLVDQKNQLELIEIFSMCDYENWILKIFGTGHLKDKLQKKIDSLNLSKNIVLNDFTQDIDSIYGQAKIFALTSIYEGFPNVLLEALAHGLPSISYDCQTGPKDIINDDDNGFLVPLSDKKLFVKKLSSLMQNSELRARISGKALQSKNLYSIDVISKHYYSLVLKHETID